MGRPVGLCTEALRDRCSAVLGVSLDTLHRTVRAGRNGNKHAMVPTCQQGVVLTVAVTADASVTADTDAARGAVRPTAAADAARGAVKPTAVDDAAQGAVNPTAADDADGLCRRACFDHHRHNLRDPLGPRRRAPDRCLAALHLWSGHGCRRAPLVAYHTQEHFPCFRR